MEKQENYIEKAVKLLRGAEGSKRGFLLYIDDGDEGNTFTTIAHQVTPNDVASFFVDTMKDHPAVAFKTIMAIDREWASKTEGKQND